MKITEALIRLEQKFLKEIQEVKMHVYALEDENQRLRAKLFDMENVEGRDTLMKLYEEGFHVCPMRFGDRRGEEECLFCHSFLNKVDTGDEEPDT